MRRALSLSKCGRPRVKVAGAWRVRELTRRRVLRGVRTRRRGQVSRRLLEEVSGVLGSAPATGLVKATERLRLLRVVVNLGPEAAHVD